VNYFENPGLRENVKWWMDNARDLRLVKGDTILILFQSQKLQKISMQSQHFPLNTLFKPAPSMKTWYRGSIVIILGLILLFTWVPIVLFSDMPAVFSVAILGSTFLLFALLWYWVGLYYESMWYELREDEITWKRGVWFRTTGIVPYNRITNLDVRQGPFMRYLGISSLAIQTAGYSGQAVPEIRIEAIEHAEELRECIRSMVRGSPARDDGTGNRTVLSINGTPVDQQILGELKNIRSLLENR
jgi:membrane protein YdbS with pleckstrin-like domain